MSIEPYAVRFRFGTPVAPQERRKLVLPEISWQESARRENAAMRRYTGDVASHHKRTTSGCPEAARLGRVALAAALPDNHAITTQIAQGIWKCSFDAARARLYQLQSDGLMERVAQKPAVWRKPRVEGHLQPQVAVEATLMPSGGRPAAPARKSGGAE